MKRFLCWLAGLSRDDTMLRLTRQSLRWQRVAGIAAVVAVLVALAIGAAELVAAQRDSVAKPAIGMGAGTTGERGRLVVHFVGGDVGLVVSQISIRATEGPTGRHCANASRYESSVIEYRVTGSRADGPDAQVIELEVLGGSLVGTTQHGRLRLARDQTGCGGDVVSFEVLASIPLLPRSAATVIFDVPRTAPWTALVGLVGTELTLSSPFHAERVDSTTELGRSRVCPFVSVTARTTSGDEFGFQRGERVCEEAFGR